MKKFLERFPWVQQAGCGVLVCALLLSICLPLMGMRSAEPENPILQAAPQEITVLQAGQAPGHAGLPEVRQAHPRGSHRYRRRKGARLQEVRRRYLREESDRILWLTLQD